MVEQFFSPNLGSKWQKRRKILTPAFHFNVLREFSGIFDQEARRMVKDLQFHGQIALDLVPFITKYTLNAICGKFITINHKYLFCDSKNLFLF